MTHSRDTGAAAAPFAEITQREHALVRADLKAHGWPRALAASQQRQDAMAGLIASTLTPPLACKAGCAWCCHFKVEVRPEEVFQIVGHVRAKFSPARQQALYDTASRNAATLQALTPAQQLSANLPCPFLQYSQCSIHAVRPARCRTLHATEVAGCQQAYEEPQNLAIPPSLVPALVLTGEAHLQGARQAFAEAGYDDGAQELNAALAVALADGRAKRRFEKGKKAFV